MDTFGCEHVGKNNIKLIIFAYPPIDKNTIIKQVNFFRNLTSVSNCVETQLALTNKSNFRVTQHLSVAICGLPLISQICMDEKRFRGNCCWLSNFLLVRSLVRKLL